MVMKRSALGRGLDALITMDDLKTGGSSSISEIELSKIQPNPDQPRSVFEEETLEELAVSIRSLGVIQPITLKETGTDKYMIISGERRYRASLMAGLERIPAYIKTDILVCVKPPRVLSTDEPGGLPDLVRQALGDPKADVRTVHRLDRVVSGLMVLARNSESASELSRQRRSIWRWSTGSRRRRPGSSGICWAGTRPGG